MINHHVNPFLTAQICPLIVLGHSEGSGKNQRSDLSLHQPQTSPALNTSAKPRVSIQFHTLFLNPRNTIKSFTTLLLNSKAQRDFQSLQSNTKGQGTLCESYFCPSPYIKKKAQY